ncbi:MAG: hypothetical protein M3O87_04230 [Candidatus Dormibacteraeota bacterium]|nr:hypothetical protein [Candidatus Dormibacteraeota bacterium]
MSSSGPRTLWPSPGGILSIAGAMVLLAVASVLLTVPGTQALDLSACQLCDGRRYLAMAGGATTFLPHAGRILVPRLVALLNLDVLDRPAAFEVIDLISVTVIAAGGGAIAWVAARRAGVSGFRAGAAAGIVVGIMLVLPMGLRWARHYPVLVDPLANALVVAWLVLSVASRRALNWIAVPVAAAAVLTRETALVLVLAALLTQVYYSRNRRAVLPIAAATLGALAVSAVVLLLAPNAGDDTGPLLGYLAGWLLFHVTTPDGWIEAGRSLLLSTGFLPLLLLRSPRRLGLLLSSDSAAGTPLLMPALTLVVAGTVVAFVAGADMARYLVVISPFVLALALAQAAVAPRLDLELALALCASIAIWAPLAAFPDSVSGDSFFSDFYYPGQPIHYLLSGLTQASPFLAAWLLLLVVTIGIRLRRRGRAAAP